MYVFNSYDIVHMYVLAINVVNYLSIKIKAIANNPLLMKN